MSLHYRIDGAPENPPLVLLNGLFADLTSWDGVMPHLAGYRVLRFDSQGQGQSPKPDEVYHLAQTLKNLEDLLLRLNWPPSAFVGISNGGCIGMALAQSRPERVTALVAADCYHQVTPLQRLKLNSWLQAHLVGGPQHRFDVAAPWIWSEAILGNHPEMVNHYRDRAGLQEDQAVRGLILGALAAEIEVTAIRCPTLLLAGEEDLLTPPFLMRRIPIKDAAFQLVPGAHASLLEQPAIFEETILPWLRRFQ